MNEYIDADKLKAEVKNLNLATKTYEEQVAFNNALAMVVEIIDSLQQEQPDVNEVEKALSLQIQAYLTTASDELYGPGKPLYTKEHHEGIHECMKMWQRLHHYYFSTKQEHSQVADASKMEQSEVYLEKEIDAVWNPRFNLGWDEHSALSMNHAGFASIAHHFYELGLNARKEE